jgi:hypothetical protein
MFKEIIMFKGIIIFKGIINFRGIIIFTGNKCGNYNGYGIIMGTEL